MSERPNILRVGGVGTGRIFQHAHLRVYPKLWDRARLVGFYDVDSDRAEQARAKYGELLREYAGAHPDAAPAMQANLNDLCCYESLDALLDRVDVIDVATHSRGRMAIAITALRKGVHAMVEKPMARVWTEADRAARVAASTPGVFLQLNDDNAFDPKYRLLHDLLARGTLGKVQHVSLIRGSTLDATSVLRAQASALDNGGGCLLDYGSHGLAGVWTALGTHYRPTVVEAVQIGVLFPHRVLEGEPCTLEVDDNAQIKVRFEDPQTGSWATVFLEASWTGGHIGLGRGKPGGQSGGYLRIIGDRGVLHTASADRITVQTWDGGESVLPLREYPGESISFDDQIGGFLAGVRCGTSPEIDVHLGAEVIAVCGAAYLSAIRGRAVPLDEFKDYCRGYVARYGDGEQADEALIQYLLQPYKRRS